MITAGVRAQASLRTAPTVVAGMALLARSAAELDADLRAAALENPALLVEELPVCPTCGRATAAGRCGRCAVPARPRWAGQPIDPDDLSASVPGWDRLRSDAVLAARPAHTELVHAVLDALDAHGLLPPERRDALERGVGCAALAAAVAAIRSAGPPGIAAADPRESLLLQLDTSPLRPAERELARRILTGQAERLAVAGPAAVAAELRLDASEVTDLLARMRRLLRPFPVPVDEVVGPAPLPPDLVFSASSTGVAVRLTERERLRVRLDPGWRDAAGPAGEHSRARRAAAQELLAHLDRRWSLLERLATHLAEHHRDTLLARSLAFGPLTQATAADRLDVHPSTVSRAVRHRTVRLLDGRVVPLQRLFGTHHDVAAAVAELACAVPRPSDRAVAEALARRGIRVARRTVTKYRLARGAS